MGKLPKLLMSLIGTAGAAAYFAGMFFSGVLSELTSLPILLMVAVGASGLCALGIGITPIFALTGGGPKEPKAKKVKEKKPKKEKKSKKDKAAQESSDDEYAEDLGGADASTFEGDLDDEYSDSFDSVAADDDFFEPGDDVSESGVAGMLDDDDFADAGDDPFDVSDSFESDVKDIELAMDGSESFDDQFELSPDSGVDFDVDDDEKA